MEKEWLGSTLVARGSGTKSKNSAKDALAQQVPLKKRRIVYEKTSDEEDATSQVGATAQPPHARDNKFQQEEGSFSTHNNNNNKIHKSRDHEKMVVDEIMGIEDLSQFNVTDCCTDGPTVFQRIVGDPNNSNVEKRQLRLLVLGCEGKLPYGPNDHTAGLLLDLLSQALQKCYNQNELVCWTISLNLFAVEHGNYPTPSDWENCDGVILPGSFSSAYSSKPWIGKLKDVIQERIVKARLATLAICFGHQVFAHSFEDGHASKVPSGTRCGRLTMQLTQMGSLLFGEKKEIDLYYTHGDMVQQLPACAVCLGGSTEVPIEAAAYFASEEEAAEASSAGIMSLDGQRNGAPPRRPYAITFQAHPKYATSQDLGYYRTFELCLDALESLGHIDRGDRLKAGQDAHDHFLSVQEQSVNVMVKVGQLLGWFPAIAKKS